MRVAVVTPWFPSEANLAMGQFVEKEVKALHRAGHDVRVIFLDRGAREVQRRYVEGVPVLVLPVDVRNPLHIARFAKELRDGLRFAEVVHSHAISVLPTLALVRPQTRWVHSEHWSALTTPRTAGPLGPCLVGAVSRFLKLPEVVLGESDRLVEAVKKSRGSGAIGLVPCVVPAPPQLQEAPKGKVLRLASTGGLIDRKDPLLAVRALKVLESQGIPASLRWVGEGPLRNEAEALAAELDVDAEFVGMLPPRGVQEEIANCDIFFAPTKGENFFVAAAEALVNGRPLCAGANGGHVEYTPPEYSEIVVEQTPEAYAEAIIRLRDKTASVSAEQIADSVRHRFSPETVAQMLEEAYGQKSPKRVVIATRIHLPEPGAASLRWSAIEKSLAQAGYQVEVLTSQYDAPAADLEGVTVKRWPVLRDSEGSLRGYLPYLSFDIPLFFRLLMTKRPDLVLVEPPPTTGIVARVACSLRGVPYIWCAADVWTRSVQSMGATAPVVAAVGWMEKTVIRGASAVLALTRGAGEAVRQMGAVAVEHLPYGIDLETYQIAEPNGGAGIPLFIYAGTASEFQGALVFLDAFEEVLKSIPRAQMYFVGSGSDWAEIEKRAEEINAGFDDGVPRVIVDGKCSPEEAAELLNRATAALVSIAPHHSSETSYPTKVLAALATGTPVIYAGGGEVWEDIESNHLGWALDYDAEQVAAAMRSALVEGPALAPEELRDWVANNRSSEMMGSIVVKVAERVLGDKQ